MDFEFILWSRANSLGFLNLALEAEGDESWAGKARQEPCEMPSQNVAMPV